MKRFLSVLVAATLSTAATAQTAVTSGGMLVESVSVTGTGRSVVTPDRFTFNVGVQTVAPTVADAVAENNRRTAAVIAALKKAGAADRNIQTSQFTIWPQQDYGEGRRLPRILGYQVANSVSVRSEKVTEAGRLLGVALGAGVNNASGINFEVADPARGRDEGLNAAFEDARAKAVLLARAAGRTLGRVLTVAEGGAGPMPPPMPMRTMAMEAKAVADVPVEAGTQENVYTVSVVFELK